MKVTSRNIRRTEVTGDKTYTEVVVSDEASDEGPLLSTNCRSGITRDEWEEMKKLGDAAWAEWDKQFGTVQVPDEQCEARLVYGKDAVGTEYPAWIPGPTHRHGEADVALENLRRQYPNQTFSVRLMPGAVVRMGAKIMDTKIDLPSAPGRLYPLSEKETAVDEDPKVRDGNSSTRRESRSVYRVIDAAILPVWAPGPDHLYGEADVVLANLRQQYPNQKFIVRSVPPSSGELSPLSDKEKETAMNEDLKIRMARLAYEGYAAFTGGKTFDGRNMPMWIALNEHIQLAWVAALQAGTADARMVLLRGLKSSNEDNNSWEVSRSTACLALEALGVPRKEQP
jgi:hypothetical protein